MILEIILRGIYMGNVPFSVCMIAKNEEKYIKGCLDKLSKYNFEIIIVDTGSTDDTKNIAIKYTDKIYDFKWIDDFSAARNFAAGKATNDWILTIDCDEYMDNIDLKKITEFINSNSNNVGMINVRNIARRNNGDIAYKDEYLPRFYNRKYYEFRYAIHESIEIMPKYKDEIAYMQEILPVELIHHGYNIDKDEMKKKQNRNLQILYKALESDVDRKPYVCFQIAQSEQILGNLDNAAKYYEKCISIEKNINVRYFTDCVCELAVTYAQMNEPEKSLELMEKYRQKINSARIAYTYAQSLLANKQFLKALMEFVSVTTLKDKETLGEDLKLCYKTIVELYELFGEGLLAEPFRQKMIE